MSIDEQIIWLNIIMMTAAVCAGVTWLPAAAQIFSKHASRIHYIAAGIVATCLATFLVRSYSFAMREFGLGWLMNSGFAVSAIALQCVAFVILAGAYFSPSRQSDLTPKHYRGVYWGAITLAALVVVKVVF